MVMLARYRCATLATGESNPHLEPLTRPEHAAGHANVRHAPGQARAAGATRRSWQADRSRATANFPEAPTTALPCISFDGRYL